MKHRFNALRSQIWETRDEQQIMALYEEAIVVADQYLTEADAHSVRMDYTNKVVEYEQYDKMLASFSWCWSAFVKHPERYSSFYMLWHFKWVIENVRKRSIYSTEQLERLFTLFKEQCEKYNFSLRPYYEAYMHMLLYSGKLKEADEYYQLWRKTKRDGLTNCQACEQHAMGGYYFSKGHYKRGLQLLKPILEGKVSCRSVPESTYEMLILPYVALGLYEQAHAYADKAFRYLKGAGNLYSFGTLIAFYTVANRRRATQIYRNTSKEALTTVSDWSKLHYLVGVQFLIEQKHSELEGNRKRKAHPGELEYPWVLSEIERLVKAFNDRNQNDFVSQRIDGLRKQYASIALQYTGKTFNR